MLKINTLSIFFFFICVNFAKADQLVWVTLDQAKTAATFLDNQSEIVAWCACCDNDDKLLIKVARAYYRHANTTKDYYEVLIQGIDDNGELVNSPFDLAYLHYNKNGMAVCVGKGLGFECDPCTLAFKWPISKPDSQASSICVDNNGFTYIGKTVDGQEYLVKVENSGLQTVGAWVKNIKPIKYTKNSKGQSIKTGGGYNLAFISMDCSSRKYDIEETIEYNSKGTALRNDKSGSYSNRVIPGTIMDTISKAICH